MGYLTMVMGYMVNIKPQQIFLKQLKKEHFILQLNLIFNLLLQMRPTLYGAYVKSKKKSNE